MSQGFEKESKTSVAKSLVGALTGLGAGFVFMFLNLAALSNARAIVHGSAIVRPVRDTLESDLMTADRRSFQLSSDGKTLRFRTSPAHGEHKLGYLVDPVTGVIRREQDGVSRHLATLPSSRFRSQNGMIVLSWKTSEGEARCSWALDRWVSGGKK